MKNWTIGKRITFGFALLLAMLTAFAGVVWFMTQRLDKCIVSITRDNIPGLRYTSELIGDTMTYRVLNLKHVIAKDAAEMIALDKQAQQQAEKVVKVIGDYRKTVVSEEERPLAEKLEPALAEYRELSRKMRAFSNEGKEAEVTAITGAVGEAYDRFEKFVTDCRDYNVRASENSSRQITTAINTTKTVTALSIIIGLLIGIAFAVLITRSIGTVLRQIATALDDGSNQVAAAAGQVSAASQTLAEGASEQAASLEETSSSLEEMASMTLQNSGNAEKANSLARQARSAADIGAADMQQMNSAMEAIKASSDDIAKIIKTIDEIAFQTNILALNAAVEAARAGEAGMGFAVVADEVRNLAQRCAQSAKETSTKIEGAISRTAQGVEISSKVTQGLNEIVAKIREVDELVSEVTSASKEQSQGVSQVNTAVGQMDKVTQSNAASAEESASAAEELNAQAQSLKEAVVQLLQLVGGSRNASQPAKHHPASNGAAPRKSELVKEIAGEAKRKTAPKGQLVLNQTRNGNRELIPMGGDFRDM